MEGASPARLYATLVGGALVIIGIIGFFYSASFGGPGEVEDVFGVFAVNGWHNLLFIATGAIGLLVASYAAREYALLLGTAYVAIAVWGFIIGDASILGFIPVNTEDSFLHLVLGLLGIGAARSTPAQGPRPLAPT